MTYDSTILAESSLTNYFKLDEAGGTTPLADSKGPLSGVYGTGVTLGLPGGVSDGSTCAQFNGADQCYIALGVPGPSSGDRAFEMWFWYDPTATSTYPCLFEQSGAASSRCYVASNPRGTLTQTVGGAPGDQQFIGIPYMSWVHFVYTQTSGVSTVYINGLAVGSQAYVMPDNMIASGQSGRIGNSTNSNIPWKGFIQKFAVYNAGLSQAQIRAHLAAGGGTVRYLGLPTSQVMPKTTRTASKRGNASPIKIVRSLTFNASGILKIVRTIHTGYPSVVAGSGGSGPVRPLTGQTWPRGVAGR